MAKVGIAEVPVCHVCRAIGVQVYRNVLSDVPEGLRVDLHPPVGVVVREHRIVVRVVPVGDPRPVEYVEGESDVAVNGVDALDILNRPRAAVVCGVPKVRPRVVLVGDSGPVVAVDCDGGPASHVVGAIYGLDGPFRPVPHC